MVCPRTVNSKDVALKGGLVEIVKAGKRKLCTLVVIDADGHLKPVARSYHAYAWEASAGPYSNITFTCKDGACTVELPILEGKAKYQLTTFDAPSTYSSSEDTAAKFLERATFGATMTEIKTMDNGTNVHVSYANWIEEQMATVPLTSHREFYRRRMNSRFEVASPVSAVTHPCQKGARYRKFAFTQKDEKKVVRISTDTKIRDGKLLLIIDGVTRTVIDKIEPRKGDNKFVAGGK